MNSTEIRDFFNENGYYHARGVFSPDEVAAMEEDFDRIVQQLQGGDEDYNARWGGEEMKRLDGGASEIVHTHNVQAFSARWTHAFMQEKFLDITEAILGPDIILHHSKLFQKPAEKGSPFPMHQDWTYFPSEKDSMMAGIIHVSDATDEMGCLRIYPGSHKIGRVESTSGQIMNDLLAKYPIEGATIVEAEKGDVVFFHYFTLHGSMPNRSSKVRKTVLAQMHSGDDIMEARGLAHPYARLVLRGWNYAATRSLASATS
jgi:ectoine hydroxylase-related dioxygenase (phytanoyl-CoA dioxygenase family)